MSHLRGPMQGRAAAARRDRGHDERSRHDLQCRHPRCRRTDCRHRPARHGTVPKDAAVRDVSGKWILPGFIDDHDHVADIRRGLLDLESWGVAANLAYGVTTAFDPSTLSIDMLAYQDLIDAGLITGSRIRSTGPAIFSFNEFDSKLAVDRVLDRYRDFYRLSNIKLYRSGNRRVREWIAQSAREHGLRVTTEGANSDKLDLTQVQDGVSGSEHALQTTPLYEDVVQLMARSGVSYNTTLMIEGGGQDYFVVERKPNGDPKLNRFAPRFIVDMKTRKRDWRDLSDAQFPAFAASARKVMLAGGIVGMGSHGEIPGLGFHWEMEAHVMGGWTPLEVLRAATLGSAEAIGREADLGSLEPGKIADLVMLDHDPLADIRNTLSISLGHAGRPTLRRVHARRAVAASASVSSPLVLGRPAAGHARSGAEARLTQTYERNSLMKSFLLTALSVVALAAASPAMGAGSGRGAATMIEIYKIAPGQHEAFLKEIARYDEANRLAGVPPRQLYVHSDGADWDFILIQPDEYPPEKQAALDKAWKQLGLPSGADFFLNYRRFIADHTDTVAIGPTSAAAYLATRSITQRP